MSHPPSSDAWALYQFFYSAHNPAARWYESSAAQKKKENEKKEKAKPKTVTVELLCRMCCEACGKRVRNALNDYSAFTSHTVDIALSKVTVSGEELKAEDVLRIVSRASGKPTEFWPKPNKKKECDKK